MNYKELNKAIKNKTFSPIYLFTGVEDYIGQMMEKTLQGCCIPKGLEPLNTTIFSEKNLNPSELVAACETLPLMSEKRLVVIKEEAELDKVVSKEEFTKFLDYLEKPSKSTILIMYMKTLDKRKKMYKLIQKNGEIVIFDKLDLKDLENWLGRRIKLLNKSISRSVLDFFIQRSRYLTNENKNMEMIDNDINKLMDYLGDRVEITKEDILLVIPESVEDGVFKMVDYAMGNEKGKALMMLNQFYLEGEAPFGIFNLLLRQLRQILMIKIYTGRGNPVKVVAGEMKIPPFIVNKILKIGKKYREDDLFKLLIQGAELDLQMKNGEIDQNLALELFVMKMS
ncbi:MAG: DNA polymerase III subunit delta [Eubacteriaceae bacterium]